MCIYDLFIVTGQVYRYQILFVLVRYVSPSLHGFKTRLLQRGFHALKNNDSFSSPIDVESHKYGEPFQLYLYGWVVGKSIVTPELGV